MSFSPDGKLNSPTTRHHANINNYLCNYNFHGEKLENLKEIVNYQLPFLTCYVPNLILI